MPFDAGNARADDCPPSSQPQKIAVIGAGISGLSAAWLLSRTHDVTLLEADDRLGGHANTVRVPTSTGDIGVDAGFIVFNTPNYPNFTALLKHLNVSTDETCMSFAVSINGGRVEYAGRTLSSVFARRSSVVSLSHWAMLKDVPRFHKHARRALDASVNDERSLGDFIRDHGYSNAFVDNFLKPFAAAIWSTPALEVLDYPVASFLKFFDNHGLLQVLNMPLWNTVRGGSQEYVQRMAADMKASVRLGVSVAQIQRDAESVEVVDKTGARERFDQVVIATHADAALRMLERPSAAERSVLGAFRYQKNRAVVHSDKSLMPRRKRAWASWNYLGGSMNEGEVAGAEKAGAAAVTYWMNQLQALGSAPDVFVTLNPETPIRPETIHAEFDYDHPMFNLETAVAQRQLWSIQGRERVWFAGAHFGQGFHEDGLQAGLAVAEALGGVRRPWDVANESGRIYLPPAVATPLAAE